MDSAFNVRQTFALDKQGCLVSVDQVARGMACDCRCPACGKGLIARQGTVREWHFAHGPSEDCGKAVESSLHLAAKAVLSQAKGLMCPAAKVEAVKRLEDGREFFGWSGYPSAWVDYDEALIETSMGAVRPDVVLVSGEKRLIVEVKVTHGVDDEKTSEIERLDVPAIEIDLGIDHRRAWTWDAVREEVLDSVEGKRWIVPLDRLGMMREAMMDAEAKAARAPEVKRDPIRYRWRVKGMIVDVVDRSWGLCVWSSFHPEVTPMVSDLCRRMGGRYKRSFRNWVVARGMREELFGLLSDIGDKESEGLAVD